METVEYKKIGIERLKEVSELYIQGFYEDSFFKKNNIDFSEGLPKSFDISLEMCLNSGMSYGAFIQDKLVGFLICFDYYQAKENQTAEFNKTFSIITSSNKKEQLDIIPYKKEIHDEVDKLSKPVLYLLAASVDKKYRGMGIFKSLISIVVNIKNYSFASDISNLDPMNMYKSLGFSLKEIEDNYYFIGKALDK